MIVPIFCYLTCYGSKPAILTDATAARDWACVIYQNELPKVKPEELKSKLTVQNRNGVWETRFNLPNEKIDYIVLPCFLYIDPRTGKSPYFKKGVQALNEVITEVFSPTSTPDTQFYLSQQNLRVPSAESAVKLFKAALGQWFTSQKVEAMGPYEALSLGDTWQVTATHPKWKESTQPAFMEIKVKDATVTQLQL